MSKDVVELILADHQRFEELMRELRNIEADRAKSRDELAALLVAHAEAEEQEVYPKLRSKKAAEDEEVEHGEKEHAEINEKLLDFLELDELKGDDYDEKLEDLVEVINHHTNEEEQTLLNDARQGVGAAEREQLGVAFLTARQVLLDTNCGRVENVRLVVSKTKDRL
ncbi:hemerythrin domain-containing protein [Amycolatopsis nigrescens]|uniref:hemerythrin domain-containing protein n=1 Tax=Amycolatopsis nigrescens TaxID=381445 RepID=UPI00036AC8CE|nr:hemerythrin domain-containing protein [Amycolatopsis nigrescens]